MNKKLQIINKSINEIREILGEECADITQLPELVRDLSEKSAKSGYTTVFVFSTKVNPNKPTGGSLDTTTGMVLGLEDIGSQTDIVTDDLSKIGMSFAIFDSYGNVVSNGSTPVNLRGPQGIQGIQGPAGTQGEQGKQGVPGINATSFRTISVYTSTDTTDSPAVPIGGRWVLSTNTITRPTTADGSVTWVLNADEVEDKTYLGMSQATFDETGEIVSPWCTPFRLTGDSGKDGVDGRGIEFIYRLLPDLDTFEKLKIYLLTNPLVSSQTDDIVPPVNDTFNIGSKGTDQPKGISDTGPIETICSRTRKSADDTGSEGSSCVIWSKWSEDGMDGDGVEYIYLVTPDKTSDETEINSDYVKHYLMPDLDAAVDHERYQEDGFCFNSEGGFEYNGTDEPSDVGKDKPLEWVSIRKKRVDESGNYVGEKFSDPKIGGRFASDGDSYLTSFVFKRSLDKPENPVGGDFTDPKPTTVGGHDSVPMETTETKNYPVWMSNRVFSSGDFTSTGSEPKRLTDTNGFQVEYTSETNVTREKISKFTGDETSWREKQILDYGIVWGDDDSIVNPIGMITSNCSNGVGSDWVLTRIKGEKGDKGADGTSVEIRGKFKTLDELKAEWDSYCDGGYFLGGTLKGGDSFQVEDTGLLGIYSGGFYAQGETNTTFELYWESVKITGDPGKNAYLYVAYSDNLGEGSVVDLTGPRKYIGVKYSDQVLSEEILLKGSTYTWTRWQGEDGGGREQVFLLTSKDADWNPNGNHLPLPSDNDSSPEYLPIHEYGNLAKGVEIDGISRGSDTPLTVSEEYPYCWTVSRKGRGDVFGEWYGDNGYSALYSRYSYDGLDGASGKSSVSVSLTNDLSVLPTEGNKIDPDFKDTVSTYLRVYIGDEEIPAEDVNVFVDSNLVSVDEYGQLTLRLDKITTDVKEIPIKVTLKGSSSEFVTTGKLLGTDSAYEISPEINVIKRFVEGENAGKLERNTFNVTIKKGSDNKGIDTNSKNVFVKVKQSDTENNFTFEPTNGIATVNLGNLIGVTGITVYLTYNNESTGDVISYEDIAIVSDGVSGEDGVSPNASFKSTVFKRASSKPDVPTGGNYDSPKPDDTSWEDGVPSGNEILGASTRMFSSDGKYPQTNAGSEPAQMSDTIDFDVEFSSFKGDPGTPDNPTPESNWSNESNENTVGMATNTAKNGVGDGGQVTKIKGEGGADGKDGNDGVGIKNIVKRYKISNDGKNAPTFDDTEPVVPGNLETDPENRYMWCKETTIYTNDTQTSIYYVVSIHGITGADGTGTDAPLLYPAGLGSIYEEYESTDKQAPYVGYEDPDNSDNSGYYIAVYKGKFKGECPIINGNVNTAYWEKMEYMKSTYADIGAFNQALVGKVVFYKNYMFSQNGYDLQGNDSDEYEYFLKDSNGNELLDPYNSNAFFKPNFCLDCTTGKAAFGRQNLVVNEDGSGRIGSSVENGITGNDLGEISFGSGVKLIGSSSGDSKVTSITDEAISTMRISADQIDTEGLVVKQLNTKPGTNGVDSVIVEENRVLIKNNVGDVNVSLSSNNISDRYNPEDLMNVYYQDSDNTPYIDIQFPYAKPDAPRHDIFGNTGGIRSEYKDLGLLGKGSSLKIDSELMFATISAAERESLIGNDIQLSKFTQNTDCGYIADEALPLNGLKLVVGDPNDAVAINDDSQITCYYDDNEVFGIGFNGEPREINSTNFYCNLEEGFSNLAAKIYGINEYAYLHTKYASDPRGVPMTSLYGEQEGPFIGARIDGTKADSPEATSYVGTPITTLPLSNDIELFSGIFVMIEKQNALTGEFEFYDFIQYSYESFKSQDLSYKATATYTFKEKSVYRICVQLNPGTIAVDNDMLFVKHYSDVAHGPYLRVSDVASIQLQIDYDLNKVFSSNIELGKNGIVVQSENGVLFMNKDKISLTMSKDEDGNFYGLKITPTGMYYCNGSNGGLPGKP